LQSVASLLKNVRLFRDLSDEELAVISKLALKRNFRERMVVFMQGEPLDRVFFVHRGRVKIYRTDALGNEQLIRFIQQGEMFPHAGFFRRGVYPAHAEVVEDSELFVIPIDSFEQMLLSYPQISIKLFRIMSERIFDLQERLEEQILHNTNDKIILLLMRLAKENGEEVADGIRIKLHLTNREMANMIGAARETVSRTLKQLKRDNYIAVDEQGYIVIRHQKLKELVIV
jgi:CRP/FNR family transcriptional regulator